MIACLIAAVALAQNPPPTIAIAEGLVIATFEQPQGAILVYLPDDVAAGDTISGMVVVQPKGDTIQERARNTAILSGIVVEIGDTEIPASDGAYRVEIPEDGDTVELSAGGSPTIVVPTAPSGWSLIETVFSAPTLAEVRRPIVLTGPFDGTASSTLVTIDGQVAPVMAESPRQCVVGSPSRPAASAEVLIKEGGINSGTHKIRILQLMLTSTATTLQPGQRAEVELLVLGLEGLQEPITIRVTNMSPDTVSLTGGETQDLEVTPDMVEPGGICGFALNLMAKKSGGFMLGAEVVPVGNQEDPPDGFKWDPTRPDLLIPDDSELDEDDDIYSKRFEPGSEKKPNTGGDGNWQERDEPEEKNLDDVTVWFQHIPSISYGRNQRIYRGGKFPIHFKYTGTECLPGKWREIVRSTIYVGESVDTLKPAHEVDGRVIPHSDSNHKGDWEIDTDAAGKAAKNADYPHQDKGEMHDDPSRAMASFGGYYSKDNPPKRDRARVIREEVEFYTFWIGPGGEICKIIKWGFTTTWEVKEGDDPFSEDAKNHAKVTTDYTDPVEVDGDSDEGKAAKKAYEETLKAFEE